MAFDADDLVVEATVLLGSMSTLVGAHSEGVLILAGDAVHLAQELSGQAHHHGRLGGVLAGRRIDIDAWVIGTCSMCSTPPMI